ncbi:MAG: hypothetical protein AAF288_00790 [Planctomycetota bacterium]
MACPAPAEPNPMESLTRLDRVEAEQRAVESARKKDRRFSRFSVRGEAELYPTGDDRLDPRSRRVKVRDVGLGGIGFVSDERLPDASIWRMVFLQSGYAVGEQNVVVRHCEAINASLYLCGSQFVASHGLLVTLGVDPADLSVCDETSEGDFLDPSGLS